MPFFTYFQNNTWGQWTVDLGRGISQYVIIEAIDREHSDLRAKEIGLYFDGSGDCSCCGKRWDEQYSDEPGTAEPMIWDSPAKSHRATMRWFEDHVPTTFVHHLDGSVVPYDFMSIILGEPDVIDAEFEDLS